MIKSSRAFDANERVAEYRKSVAVVQENLLLFKGFLGPTVKDKPELGSVGVRAARAAGVIVDAVGKLRCPPGTPNANQFTDMQMSNCLIPNAETIARGAASLSGKMIDGAKNILKSENVRNGAKATALAALQVLDYLHVDGSGSLTDSTLMSMLLLRTGGAQLLEFASESLEKRGKISGQRKEQIDAISSKLKKDSVADARNFVLANLKRRKEKKEKQKEPASSLSPIDEQDAVDRAVAKLTDASELLEPPSTDHATSAQIKNFNAEVLAKAPNWGRVSDDDIKKINDSKIYGGSRDLLTLEERQIQRRSRMAKKISDLRNMIESGAQTDEDGFLFSRVIDPKTHEFILTHTDSEVLQAIEQTALKIAKARKPEASVWAKGRHLEAYLTDGYRPMSEGAADANVGEAMTSLLGNRGQYEASIGAEYGSGVRPIYGFSRFTFWDDELKRITDEKNLEAGEGTFSTDHYLTIPGRGAGGIGGYQGAFAGDAIGYGDMEFVLHAEVADRTTIHHRDSILNPTKGTAAVGASDEELVETITGHLSDSDMNDNINRLLRTHVTQDFVNWTRSSGNNEENMNPNGQYTESNILGGFTAQDIKEVKLDGQRLFPNYKDQFNPGGVDGAELIQKIEDQHLSTEQLLEAGFTMGEIEVARAKISGWKTQNAQGNRGRNEVSGLSGERQLDGLIIAIEMERITSLVAEKAPHAKVIFGSADGRDMANPTQYKGGKVGDRITDIWGERVRKKLLEDVKGEIQRASQPVTAVEESVV